MVMKMTEDKSMENMRFVRKLPIPQDQIDINERLSQNEGY